MTLSKWNVYMYIIYKVYYGWINEECVNIAGEGNI